VKREDDRGVGKVGRVVLRIALLDASIAQPWLATHMYLSLRRHM
jgi:hypothetical protein